MKGFKETGFQERAAASALAKNRALEKLKAAPKPDEAELAARAAHQLEREAREAAKRAAAREKKNESQRLAHEATSKAKNEPAKAETPSRTEAELKAARDARYAARKKRRT